MARLVSYAVAGVPDESMGEGPIPAAKLALKKGGVTFGQMDVIESNEALAALGLELGMEKTNPDGGPSLPDTRSVALVPSRPRQRLEAVVMCGIEADGKQSAIDALKIGAIDGVRAKSFPLLRPDGPRLRCQKPNRRNVRGLVRGLDNAPELG